MNRSLFVIENGRGEFWMPRRDRDAEMDHYGANSHRSDPTAGIVEYVPRQMWIPVGERLPEPGGRYLVRNAVGYIGSDLLQSLVSGGTKWAQTARVTHWMPLPEGPAE